MEEEEKEGEKKKSAESKRKRKKRRKRKKKKENCALNPKTKSSKNLTESVGENSEWFKLLFLLLLVLNFGGKC